jgi:hypothetical protein
MSPRTFIGIRATVGGRFLEQNAVALIEQLKQPSIQIEYSLFFEQVFKYDVPLNASAKTLVEFDACIGNADLLWLRRGH